MRLSRARAIALPDIAERDDELGDLARSLEDMTHTLSDRMEAIERFAADVAHEIRNPLTSIRSAVETLDLVKDAGGARPAARHPEAGRRPARPADHRHLQRLAPGRRAVARAAAAARPGAAARATSSASTRRRAEPGDPHVRFIGRPTAEPLTVPGREGPLGQVFRNLIDNARSFSPAAAARCG